MKNAVLAFCFTFAVSPLHAQKFEFGLNVGLVTYTLQNFYSGSSWSPSWQDYTSSQSSVTAPVFSLKSIFNYKKYQVGLSVENRTYNYRFFSEHQWSIGSPLDRQEFQLTNYETPVRLLVNRIFKLKKLEAYTGISAACIFITSQNERISPSSWGVVETQKATRWVGAIQVGATYFITKHLGINAEVSGEYNNFPSGPLDKNVFSVPATLGVRYKL